MVDFDPKIKVRVKGGDVNININQPPQQPAKQDTTLQDALSGSGANADFGDGFTRSNIPVESKNNNEPELKPEPQPQPEPKPEANPEPQPQPQPKPEPQPKPKPKPVIAMPVPSNVNNGTVNGQHGQVNINAQNGSTVIINSASGKTEETTETAPVTPDIPHDESKTSDLPNKEPDPAELRRTADMIYNAIKGFGTDDAKLDKALKTITADNIVELAETYNKFYPDMFENVLDDLSGGRFTEVANQFKEALLERLKDTPKHADAQRLAGKIDGELSDWVSYESRIAEWLNEMVALAKEVEA